MSNAARTAIGCMTGTSMDGLDAALVRLEGAGLEMRASLVGTARVPLGPAADSLRRLAGGDSLSAREIAQAAHALGSQHAIAARSLIAGHGPVDFVAAHGQTVFHRGRTITGERASTWQLLDPWPIARSADCPVVYDLRGADVEAGGEGAPITPLADWALFREVARRIAVVNLGGYSNVTWLEAARGVESIAGRDVCSCNHLLNAAARVALDKPMDTGGEAALAGDADPKAVAELVGTLRKKSEAGRSLGSGDEAIEWVETWSAALSASDLLASGVDATARVIGEAIGDVDLALLAGGGARNAALAGAIERHAGVPVETTEGAGIPVEAREAAAIAVLGALSADGVGHTLPNVTGRSATGPVGGAWINLRGPL